MLSVLMLIAGVVSWPLLTTCTMVREAPMQRFHLQTNSSWAGLASSRYLPCTTLQTNTRPSIIPQGIHYGLMKMKNALSTTESFSFADARDYYLSQKKPMDLLETSYREEKLVSKYHLKPQVIKNTAHVQFLTHSLSSTFDHESSAEP